ncbi:DMT family transporter [Neobacillus cucumis]|uniref:DMT family transporter n=1 Tax=Neobacillus cucumis TaxID=1740721 RepID=UPI0028530E5B|nr:DMT family transporter [Neobacillus cucumis]MDR4946022.1 DMT family transporter [Neobacillus cucumis]
MSKVLVGSICLLSAASMWGGMYVVSKYMLEYVSPFFLLWLRYLIAFFLLGFCWYFQKKQRIERRDFPLMVWLGFIGYCVSNGSGFIGTHLSTAHMGALIESSSPAFTLLFAYFLIKEKLTWKKVISVAMATCGLFLVIGMEKGDRKGHLLGNLILMLGAISWALYSVNIKKIGSKYSSLTITTFTTGTALLFMTPVMLLDLRTQDFIILKELPFLMGILYLGVIATAAAFFLWNKGMELMEAGIGSMFYFFVPVIGGVFGWLFLGEVISSSFLAGGLFIFIGSLIIFLKKPQFLTKNNIAIELKAGKVSGK